MQRVRLSAFISFSFPLPKRERPFATSAVFASVLAATSLSRLMRSSAHRRTALAFLRQVRLPSACFLFTFLRSPVTIGTTVAWMCGCLLALWLTGVPLNVSSYTDIIMIVGILAENSIFTVWQYRMNRRRGGAVDESVDYAIALRIRPKLMTAIGAILALMPLALGLGMGAQMQQPLAVAVIGGFVVGLPLLLVVLPALMRRIYR